VYWRDPEFRMFIGVQLTLVVICTLVLWFHNIYDSALTTLNQAFFLGETQYQCKRHRAGLYVHE
ncbi:potassium transporter, partial [Salmonella enterica subsp. enterica serovar Heidelberg str. N4496]